MMDQSIKFDLGLINRYDKAGPRYTSYPTALELHEGFGDKEYRQHIAKSNAAGGPLSLYFHIPFCDTVCFYCACNKIVTKNRKHAEPYLANLCKEIAMQGDLFDSNRVVNQLHWGGGTPTFLSYEQMKTLMAVTREHFHLRDDDKGEYSIEVDPRETNDQTMKQLRELGFNRVSLGLQDFDPAVQKAVNRLQSEEQTFSVLEAARAEGFRSTNIDLIYGLPLQTVETFAKTLDKILAVRRIVSRSSTTRTCRHGLKPSARLTTPICRRPTSNWLFCRWSGNGSPKPVMSISAWIISPNPMTNWPSPSARGICIATSRAIPRIRIAIWWVWGLLRSAG